MPAHRGQLKQLPQVADVSLAPLLLLLLPLPGLKMKKGVERKRKCRRRVLSKTLESGRSWGRYIVEKGDTILTCYSSIWRSWAGPATYGHIFKKDSWPFDYWLHFINGEKKTFTPRILTWHLLLYFPGTRQRSFVFSSLQICDFLFSSLGSSCLLQLAVFMVRL